MGQIVQRSKLDARHPRQLRPQFLLHGVEFLGVAHAHRAKNRQSPLASGRLHDQETLKRHLRLGRGHPGVQPHMVQHQTRDRRERDVMLRAYQLPSLITSQARVLLEDFEPLLDEPVTMPL